MALLLIHVKRQMARVRRGEQDSGRRRSSEWSLRYDDGAEEKRRSANYICGP